MKKKERVSLIEMYETIVPSEPSSMANFSKWEKIGDVYKQFSIYDSRKYDTMSSTNIIIKK